MKRSDSACRDPTLASLRGTVRPKTRASRRASPAEQALRSDVVRRAASRGGTLRCTEARRVAYRDVDKSYASHRRPLHGAVARRLQDSVAAIRRAPKRAFPQGSDHLGEPQVLLLKNWTVSGF